MRLYLKLPLFISNLTDTFSHTKAIQLKIKLNMIGMTYLYRKWCLLEVKMNSSYVLRKLTLVPLQISHNHPHQFSKRVPPLYLLHTCISRLSLRAIPHKMYITPVRALDVNGPCRKNGKNGTVLLDSTYPRRYG